MVDSKTLTFFQQLSVYNALGKKDCLTIVSITVLCNFSKFYQDSFFRLGKGFSSPVTLPSTIAC